MSSMNESDLLPNEDDWIDEWDEEREEAGPALYYVALWYQALHPLDQTSADVPGANSDVSEPPDIFNRTKHLVWEAISGDYEPMQLASPTEGNSTFFDLGTANPDAASATTKPLKQLPDIISRLNGKAGSDLWTTGTLQNDPELAAFFDQYPGYAAARGDGWCEVPFSDGTMLSLRRPTSDGVLLYQATTIGGPQLIPIGSRINAKARCQAIVDAARANPPRIEPAG